LIPLQTNVFIFITIIIKSIIACLLLYCAVNCLGQ